MLEPGCAWGPEHLPGAEVKTAVCYWPVAFIEGSSKTVSILEAPYCPFLRENNSLWDFPQSTQVLWSIPTCTSFSYFYVVGLQSCHFSRQDSLCFLADFHFTFPSNEFQEHAGKALVKLRVSCICVEKRKPHLYFFFTNATFLSSSRVAHQWCFASYLASEWLWL